MAGKKEKQKKTGEKSVRKPQSLHDEVVKDFFYEKDTAISFFKEYLQPDIVRNLDFKTLEICKDTFLNKRLAKYFSDILYKVPDQERREFTRRRAQ